MFTYIFLGLCGLAYGQETLIVGGRNVSDPGKWPFMGVIRYTYSGAWCGISLISSRWGLTTAYCVDVFHPEKFTFMFGSNNLLDEKVVVKARQIIKHEGFDDDSGGFFPNDIALVEFAEEVKGVNIASVPLAAVGTNFTGNENCSIIGWGDTIVGSPSRPNILQEAETNFISLEACRKAWGLNINDGHICSNHTEASGCSEDDGSAFLCQVNNQYELVGLTSGAGCLVLPDIHTSVVYFRDWIKRNSGV